MRERRGATWKIGIANDRRGARATPVMEKKHTAFGTKEWNDIEHAVRDLIQRLAAYGDVILNDEGADLTAALSRNPLDANM